MENIEISQASGIDRFSGGFLKDGAKILSKTASEICSLSISHGIFPDACKVAKLKPIFKKVKQVDPSNYRPILLLPLILKIIEKIFTTRQMNSSQTTVYQSGLRTHHSTNLSLSFLTDKILKGFDEGLLTGMILIHLTKSF